MGGCRPPSCLWPLMRMEMEEIFLNPTLECDNLEDHSMTCKWLITMDYGQLSPLIGVIPLPNGHSWLIHGGY